MFSISSLKKGYLLRLTILQQASRHDSALSKTDKTWPIKKSYRFQRRPWKQAQGNLW
jgi:hypothetical protein